jgi:hypothetical protein
MPERNAGFVTAANMNIQSERTPYVRGVCFVIRGWRVVANGQRQHELQRARTMSGRMPRAPSRSTQIVLEESSTRDRHAIS